MCLECKPLIDAIDSYIKKADDDLEDTLDDEGRVMPEETVSDIDTLETLIAAALLSETDYYINEIKKRKNLQEVLDALEEIADKDVCKEEIKTAMSDKLHEEIPKFVKQYVKIVDPEIKITGISKRAYAWIDNWSAQLADIMHLTSYQQIESILKKGLDNGSDIASVTLDIMNSGIRDEYYRARRVAVTEMLRAHNVAKQEAAMQNPCINEKMWRHTGAHKNEPRENHVAMDGQKVAVNEPFVLEGADGVTYYPMFPVDPDLPPGESINCHCISQDIVDEDILAMSLEDRQALRQQIIDEMDDEWEKELGEKNKAKAGIEE